VEELGWPTLERAPIERWICTDRQYVGHPATAPQGIKLGLRASCGVLVN